MAADRGRLAHLRAVHQAGAERGAGGGVMRASRTDRARLLLTLGTAAALAALMGLILVVGLPGL
jgi:hypothetical protein